jgi:hypothetical protein
LARSRLIVQVQALGTAANRLATLHDWARAVGTSLGYASSANLLVRYLKHGRPYRPQQLKLKDRLRWWLNLGTNLDLS